MQKINLLKNRIIQTLLLQDTKNIYIKVINR